MCIRLKSCCCGCSLTTGCIVLAILGMVGSGLNAIGSFIRLDFIGGFSSIIWLGISFMLYYGAKHRKTAYVLAYFIIDIIGVIIGAVASLVMIILAIVMTQEKIMTDWGFNSNGAYALSLTFEIMAGILPFATRK